MTPRAPRRTARSVVAACLSRTAALLDGTTPTTDRMGFVFPSLQSEANFWYDYCCRQAPKGHWLQPGSTGQKGAY